VLIFLQIITHILLLEYRKNQHGTFSTNLNFQKGHSVNPILIEFSDYFALSATFV